MRSVHEYVPPVPPPRGMRGSMYTRAREAATPLGRCTRSVAPPPSHPSPHTRCGTSGTLAASDPSSPPAAYSSEPSEPQPRTVLHDRRGTFALDSTILNCKVIVLKKDIAVVDGGRRRTAASGPGIPRKSRGRRKPSQGDTVIGCH
jgi:hypothetical protein